MPDYSERPSLQADTAHGTKWLIGGICVLLAALVGLVFGHTVWFEFVYYDDHVNVFENPEVTKGLTLAGVAYAFTHSQVGHWDPLTTISHMLDCQLFGLEAGGHHLGNVLLHGAAAILLFLVLWQMTSALWRSAFVAAVFAIHPLRVESVAWVTERKDVLSGVFCMLTLAAYVRYVRQPHTTARYLAVVVLFALGLMSKSMLVTLPFVLLLLDYWPLGRFAPTGSQQSFRPTLMALVREKIPLLALSALAAVIQLWADHEAIIGSERMTLLTRIGNAFVSYTDYIGQMFYPSGLSVFYPHPGNALPLGKATLALALLLAISATAYALRKARPWLLVGWLWYLGMLVPVIGLVQSGELARADRYTYLPQIGLYLLLTWTAADLCARLPHRWLLLGSLSAGIITALALTARRQTFHWHDTRALWINAIACNPRNVLAHEQYATALSRKGSADEAMAQHEKALEIDPNYEPAHNNLGLALFEKGRVSEAITHYKRALEINPRYEIAHNNLGTALLQTGQVEEAAEHFKKAIEIKPDFAGAEANLANTCVRTGRLANAVFHYQKAIEIDPKYAKAHGNLGSTLLQTGRPWEAVAEFEKALELQPDYHLIQNNLARVLATHPDASLRDGPRAVVLAEGASKAAGGKNALFLRTLAAAYAEAGRFTDAVQTAQHALELPEAQADAGQSAALRAELELYQAGSPFHESH